MVVCVDLRALNNEYGGGFLTYWKKSLNRRCKMVLDLWTPYFFGPVVDSFGDVSIDNQCKRLPINRLIKKYIHSLPAHP